MPKYSATTDPCRPRRRRPRPPSPPYRTTLRLAGAAALGVAVSSQLLWLVVQRARAPPAGGWLLGRAVVLSDEMVDVDIDMVD